MVAVYEDDDDVRVSAMTFFETGSNNSLPEYLVATRRFTLSRLTGIAGRNRQTRDLSPQLSVSPQLFCVWRDSPSSGAKPGHNTDSRLAIANINDRLANTCRQLSNQTLKAFPEQSLQHLPRADA